MALTPRQQEILAFIVKFKAEQGMPPTRAEIAKKFSFRSANAANEHLKAMERRGAVLLVSGKARGIVVA